jgi:hypothetical protein
MITIQANVVLNGLDAGDYNDPAKDPVQTGFIDEGSACAKTGTAWADTSYGTEYGHGKRFDYEETPSMTKIPGRNTPDVAR